jgi:hypothetical protein
MEYAAVLIVVILILVYDPLYIREKLFVSRIGKIETSGYLIPNVYHVFWTGGYDSTFRICQLVLDANKYVQPIYICDPCIDDTFMHGRRKNRRLEVEAMDTIRMHLENECIKRKLPIDLLLPTLYVTRVVVGGDIFQSMYKIYWNGGLSRPVSQYSAMAEVTRQLNIIVEVCVENDNHSIMGALIKPYILEDKLIDDKPHELEIFDRMRFPIIHLSKCDMYKIAHADDYDYLLQFTFSCWYPKGLKPCGQCVMCKQRLLA